MDYVFPGKRRHHCSQLRTTVVNVLSVVELHTIDFCSVILSPKKKKENFATESLLLKPEKCFTQQLEDFS